MEHIQSTKNVRVKEWKKLLAKKGRDHTNTYLVEGFHLVEEALKTNDVIEIMIQENNFIPEPWDVGHIPITKITAEISKAISDTETAQGIFAVCQKTSSVVDLSRDKRILLLDRVQDPGNIGTMIRTAEAAGMDAVIFGEGTGDLYNPKVIRSAQGSHFQIKTELGNLLDWLHKLESAHIPVYGTALENAVPYKSVNPTDTFAIILGNEGSGVSPQLLKETRQNLYIPIYGKSESLNVAIAAGILMYHLRNESI